MGRKRKNAVTSNEPTALDTIGKRLQFIRTTLFQCSQSEFAQLAGISLSTYSKNESDHLPVGPSTLRKLSRLINLPMDWLVKGQGSIPENLEKSVNPPGIAQSTASAPPQVNKKISAANLEAIIEIATDPMIQKLARQISNSCDITEETALTELIWSRLNP